MFSRICRLYVQGSAFIFVHFFNVSLFRFTSLGQSLGHHAHEFGHDAQIRRNLKPARPPTFGHVLLWHAKLLLMATFAYSLIFTNHRWTFSLVSLKSHFEIVGTVLHHPAYFKSTCLCLLGISPRLKRVESFVRRLNSLPFLASRGESQEGHGALTTQQCYKCTSFHSKIFTTPGQTHTVYERFHILSSPQIKKYFCCFKNWYIN